MNANNRSARHFITTRVQARAALWERLFGTVTLPVLHSQPRVQQMAGQGSMLAYDLDLRALHTGDRFRLAAYAAGRYGQDYNKVRRSLETAVSWPIEDRGDIELVMVEEASPSFSFINIGRWHGIQYSAA